MTIRLDFRSGVILIAVLAIVVVGVAYAAVQIAPKQVGGSFIVGKVTVSDLPDHISLTNEAPPSTGALTTFEFGTGDLQPNGTFKTIQRIPFFAAASGDVHVSLTLEASDVKVNGLAVNTADFLTLVMGPAGGTLTSSADGNAQILLIGANPLALEATMELGGSAAQLGLEQGDVITFTALFEGSEYVPPPPVEVVTNGSLESGDFTGWSLIEVSGGILWTVTSGSAPDGTFFAKNTFTSFPGSFAIYQDVTIPSGMALNLYWVDRITWSIDLLVSLPNSYKVEVRDPVNGDTLAALFSFSTTGSSGDTGFVAHTADLSSFAGSTVRVWIEGTTPNIFEGPTLFAIDAISTLGLPQGFTP